MPIFEYLCKDCGKKFEAIVYGSTRPECPSCHGKKLEQQLSVFAVAAGASKSTPAFDAAPSPCGTGCCGGGACALDD